jgi:hypothetical protein
MNEARGVYRGQRQSAVSSGDGILTLFQFGTFNGRCSAPATLNLNLSGATIRIWTKTQSGNTLAIILHHVELESGSTGF